MDLVWAGTTAALASAWVALAVHAWRLRRSAGPRQTAGEHLAFYFFGLTLLTGIAGGYFPLGDAFKTWWYPQAPRPEAARPPLAVCGGALVLALFALVDLVLIVRRNRPLNVVVPRYFERWLPGLIAVAVGGLIGTTVFR